MLRFLRAFTPGPTVALLAEWVGLFYGTILTLSVWEASASKLALGIGSALVSLAYLLLKDAPKKLLWALALLFAALFGAGLLACMYYRDALRPDTLPVRVNELQDQWMYAFVGTMVSLMLAITFGALSLEERVNNFWRVFWSVCALVGIALLAINAVLLIRG